MKLMICLFKLFDSFLELYVVHKEVSVQMIKIWMQFFICFDHFTHIIHAFIVLFELFQKPSHQKMLIDELNILQIDKEKLF